MHRPHPTIKSITVSLSMALLMLTAALVPVIGSHTTQHAAITHSPLFQIRTQCIRTKQPTQGITTHSLGKHVSIDISFPDKNQRLIRFQKTVDGISRMSDETFTDFVSDAVHKIQVNQLLTDKELQLLPELFKFIRENPDEAKKYPFDMKQHSYTLGCPPPTFTETPEWCFVLCIYLMILIITFPIWFPVYALYMFGQEVFLNLTYRNLCLTLRPRCE